MTIQSKRDIGTAIENALVSPNECDSNLEAANVVDGLFAIARAISGHTAALEHGALALEGLVCVLDGKPPPRQEARL
jgi:hypothetical protein